MESLCYSANKESEDAYDVSTSLIGYEPNFVTFGKLNDSSVPFSFMIPSSDQDVDDVTLGKLLTEAHRGQADYCEPEGVSVSQSSSSVEFDGSGQPDGERNVDQSVNFGVTRNTYSAHSKFSENTRTEKMVDRTGKPEERNSSNAQIRTLLEEQRRMIIAEYCEKIGHHQLQAAHAEEDRQILQVQLWHFPHKKQVKQMDVSGFKNHTYNASLEERARYRHIWVLGKEHTWFTLQKSRILTIQSSDQQSENDSVSRMAPCTRAQAHPLPSE